MLHCQSVIVLKIDSIAEEWLVVLARRRRLLSLLLSLSVSQFSQLVHRLSIPRRALARPLCKLDAFPCLAKFPIPRAQAKQERESTPFSGGIGMLALFRSILDRRYDCVAPIPRWSSDLVSFVGERQSRDL